MNPVKRAGSVSDISSHHSFFLKNFDVFMREAGLTDFCDRASPVTGHIWRGPHASHCSSGWVGLETEGHHVGQVHLNF